VSSSDVPEATVAFREFVSTIAHELRSPLSSIGGFASTLLHYWESLGDEEKTTYLGIIERQVSRMQKLIDDLVLMAKIESGGLRVLAVPVSVLGAIRQTVKDRSPEAKVVCPDDLQATADPDHVQQILGKLVENAYEYGGGDVTVRASESGETVEILVCDRGEGLTRNVERRLFEKFVRTDSAKGSGLGLWVAKSLAELNGGTLRYEPSQPSGACFVLTLPSVR
jgi:signal transduction histidine kinase